MAGQTQHLIGNVATAVSRTGCVGLARVRSAIAQKAQADRAPLRAQCAVHHQVAARTQIDRTAGAHIDQSIVPHSQARALLVAFAGRHIEADGLRRCFQCEVHTLAQALFQGLSHQHATVVRVATRSLEGQIAQRGRDLGIVQHSHIPQGRQLECAEAVIREKVLPELQPLVGAGSLTTQRQRRHAGNAQGPTRTEVKARQLSIQQHVTMAGVNRPRGFTVFEHNRSGLRRRVGRQRNRTGCPLGDGTLAIAPNASRDIDLRA